MSRPSSVILHLTCKTPPNPRVYYAKGKRVHAHVRLGVLFVYVPGQGSSNVFANTGVLPVEPNDLGKLIRKKRKIMLQL
jgi:hypothetical protein